MGNAFAPSGVEKFVLFLDENHCRNRLLLDVIRRAGVAWVSYLDVFAPSIPDAQWLPQVGARGWCLLTSDIRIRYNHLERGAVGDNQVRMFYFSRNNMGGAGMAKALERALSRMIVLFHTESAPFIAAITRNGEVFVRVSNPDF